MHGRVVSLRERTRGSFRLVRSSRANATAAAARSVAIGSWDAAWEARAVLMAAQSAECAARRIAFDPVIHMHTKKEKSSTRKIV